ncbi:MAG: FAD-dependent oxidoreductase [Anaerolineae bacterium]|jgi:fumarate reductase flavoprotein subunit
MTSGSASNARQSRRGFLKGSVVLGGGLAAGALAPAAASAQEAEEAGRTLEADVLVVGSGLAGLTAAARAAEQGANVLLIEKLAKGYWAPGGDMPLSGQMLIFAGSTYSALDAGVEQLEKQLTEGTGGMAPPELIKAAAETAGTAYQWIKDQGCEFEERALGAATVPVFAPSKIGGGYWGSDKPGGETDASEHGGKVAALKLEANILESGGQILYETKAESLITDDSGAVVGVRARDAEGPFTIKAKATILCTGAWSLDRAMIAQYVTQSAESFYNATYGTPGSTGDGHKMAIAIGAAPRSLNYTYSIFMPAVVGRVPNHDLRMYSMPFNAGVVVGASGERLYDEALGRHVGGHTILRKEMNNLGYFIIDSKMYEGVAAQVEKMVELGGEVYSGETFEELAEAAGISPYLATTMEEYNAAAEAGTTSKLRIPRGGEPAPINEPPFYAVPFVVGTCDENNAAIMVNPKAEVLDVDGNVIPGLYAAGHTMHGAYAAGLVNEHGGHVGGLANALVFGYISANSAVEYVSAE